MKTKIVVLCILFLTSAISMAVAQVSPDSVQKGLWEAFNQRYQGKWTIRWDEETGTPASIYGHRTEATSQITAGAEVVAKNFFAQNKRLFKLRANADDLTIKRQLEHQGMHHLYFLQTYSGIPVYGGEYNVTLGQDGSLRMVSGKFFPNIEMDIVPSVTASQAEQSAQKHLNVLSLRQNPLTELVIFSKSGQYLLAFKVILLAKEPLKDWLTMVDAKTGEIIFSEDVTVHIDGSGYVYPKDPVNSSLTTVTLPRLAGAGNYLEGSYVKALNEDQARAYSPNAQFFYTPPSYTQMDYTHFDEVNLYYHVDRFANHLINNVQFSGLGRIIDATAHVGTNYNNAFYDIYGTRNLFFGDGDRIRFYDFAKKDDVIYHEFQHAVSHYIGLQYSGESAALHEGYSDYFPASYTSDYHIGEWVTIGYPDLRTLATSATDFNFNRYNIVSYPNNPAGSAHANSMIWSGALWDLKAQLNSSITDFLALKGIYYRNGNATFLQAREGIIQANIDYYGGAHVNTIKNVLAARGIGQPATPPPHSVSVSGPEFLQLWTNGEYTASVTGGSGNFSYAWYRDAEYVGDGNPKIIGAVRIPEMWVEARVTDNSNNVTQSGWMSVLVYCDGCPQSIEEQNASDLPQRRIPVDFALSQNYPNPFNPETEITFGLPEPSNVTITITDLLGREVTRLADGEFTAGYQRARWNGTDAAGNKVGSGIYFYRITATGESGKQFTKVMKLLLLK